MSTKLAQHSLAAPQDVPALAVSLDNYAARSEEQYATAATYTVAVMKAVLVRRGECWWLSRWMGSLRLTQAMRNGVPCRTMTMLLLEPPLVAEPNWRAPARPSTQGVLPPPAKLAAGPSLAARLCGHVINLNVPKADTVADILGYHLAWQGQHCHFPDWKVRLAWLGWCLSLRHVLGTVRAPRAVRRGLLPCGGRARLAFFS